LFLPCPQFCPLNGGVSRGKSHYKLIALLSVRTFKEDSARMWTPELICWLHYHRYAGVEKVLIYESYKDASESQAHALLPFIDEGFVEVFDWSSENYPYSKAGQMQAYAHGRFRYRHNVDWIIHTDVDEYVWSPLDQEPGWLTRQLERARHNNVGVVLLPNYGVGGRPTTTMVFLSKYRKKSLKPLNNLVKPIELVKGTALFHMHNSTAQSGYQTMVNASALQMLHYWGHRMQHEKATHDFTIPLATRFQQCIDRCSNFYWTLNAYWQPDPILK